VLDLIPAAQRAAFAKEDGEAVIDAAGKRITDTP
jgi:arsenate reductase